MRKAAISALLVLAMMTSLVPASAGTITYGHNWGLQYDDGARAVAIDGQGNVYIAGYTHDGGSGSTFVAKFDVLGQLVWDRVLGVESGSLDIFDIAVDDAGNAYVCGNMYMASPGQNFGFMYKFASDGTPVFSYVLDDYYMPLEIELDSQGFVIAGVDWNWDTVVSAFTSTGSLRWAVRGHSIYDWGFASAYGLAVDSADNVIITMDRLDEMSDVGFAMLDSNGNLIRQMSYQSLTPDEYLWDVMVGSDGYIYGLGWSISEQLLFLVKLTPTLDFVWGEKIGNPLGYQECWKIVGQPDGTFYTIGSANDVGTGGAGPALFHFTSEGALLEASYYALSDFGDAYALPNGGFVLAGHSYGPVDLTPIPLSGVEVTPVASLLAGDSVIYETLALQMTAVAISVYDPFAIVDEYDPLYGGQAWFGYVDAVLSQFPVEISYRQSSSNPTHVTFRGSASGGDRPYTYTWQFGDGASGTGARVVHDYASSGTFHVSLLAMDSIGQIGVAATDVIVPGPPVIGEISCAPAAPLLNQNTTFSVSAYDPDGGAIAWYDWAFGDGTYERTYFGTVDHVYTAVGTYTVTVTAADDEGLGTTSQLTIEVNSFNNPPSAVFTVNPASGNTTTVFVVNATTSSDLEDPISALMVRWDWESDGYWDTNWSTSKTSSHIYSSAGVYTIRLEVMDTGGLKSNTSRTVTVNSGDWTTLLYEPFDSWQSLDPAWTVFNATYMDFSNWFDVQGGLLIASNNGVLAYDHYLSYLNWTRPFNYSGELEITYSIYLPLDYNEKIGWSGQVFWVILYDTSGYAGLITRFVMDLPGDTADIGWVNWQGEEPVEICPFSAGWHEVSMRMSAAGLYWTPTFDGVVQAPQMFRAPSGAFEVGKIAFINALREEVQVVALDTVEVAASGMIVTPNLSPVASFTVSPQYAYVGDAVTFDGSSSYDPDGNITDWGWEYGDGTEGQGEVISHPYYSPGTYTATLTVWDDEGYTGTATATVVVIDVGERANWTFLVYEDGDNNLEEVALVDFIEMSSVGSTNAVNIVVQMDRHPYFDSGYGDWSGTKRFYVTQGMTPTASNAIMDLGEQNMGDPATLEDFIEWGVMTFPADKYMLVLWDHGGGWDGAVCWDDTDFSDALTLDELQTAINISEQMTGEWIDSVGFDACLMGMAEVAYEIKDCTDYLVFSEETIPWDGWPYDAIMADLVSNPFMDPDELGARIVQRYSEFYGYSGYETLSVATVPGLMSVFGNIDVFASELLQCLPTYKMEITASIGAAEYFAYYEYRDLYDFVNNVRMSIPVQSLQSAAWALMFSLNASIHANFTGQGHPDAHGLSIFLPVSSSSYMLSYETLDMSVDLAWDEFLKEFSMTLPDAYEPDDTYLQANEILPGIAQIHTIDDYGADIDWVTFSLSNMTQVRVSTDGPEGVGDSVLRLFNLSGVPDWPMAENDDSNDSYWSRITAWLAPGTYWVEVSSYEHWADIPYYELLLSYGPFPNEPPYAQWYSYGSPYVGGNMYFEGGISFDPDGYIVDYYWDFGDGSYSYGSWVSHVYYSAGEFLVTLTVTDNQGAYSNASGWVYITGANILPVPVAVITPENPTIGESVVFDGTMSYDPDGYVIDWYWNFGDGTGSYGSVVNHAYMTSGTYHVELYVCDNSGQWGFNMYNITVRESASVPPIAVIVYWPSQPFVWQSAMFDGTYSVDPDGYIVSFIWQFGDGTVGFGAQVWHSYQQYGTYMVSLSVIDNYGLSDETVTTIKVVSLPNAAFEYTPLLPMAGQQTNFYAWGSSDQSGIVEYIWSFGDGTYASGWQATHVFASAGNYIVTLVVRNSDGITANYSEIVPVSASQLLTVGTSGSASDADGLRSPMMVLSLVALVGAYAAGSGAVAWMRRR